MAAGKNRVDPLITAVAPLGVWTGPGSDRFTPASPNLMKVVLDPRDGLGEKT